jgi:cytochrome c oxidase subunit 2
MYDSITNGVTTTSGQVDWVFDFILVISLVFFALICVLGTLFVIRYRRRPGREAEASPAHSTKLELLWSVIPSLLTVAIFYFSFDVYLKNKSVPGQSMTIDVEAFAYGWEFSYLTPEGRIISGDGKLHVPAGVPVRLNMTSRDVIHSFYVPDFRIKMDVVPKRFSTTWFQVNEPGEHALLCAEYCGSGHSNMYTAVVAHTPDGYRKWLSEQGVPTYGTEGEKGLTSIEVGEKIFLSRSCANCHKADGSGSAPSLVGLYGRKGHKLTSGTVDVDENYLLTSIRDPAKDVAAGYAVQMEPYGVNKIDDNAMRFLMDYLKSIGAQ